MRVTETGIELVRAGIIGLGDHSERSHLQYLTEMPDICEIIAVGDIDERRIKDTNDRYGLSAPGFTVWQELVRSDDVDAVFVMTPDRFHTVQLAGAVAMGKHVFCEKPLASTDEEYQNLVETFNQAERRGNIISTCHPRRFDPPFIIAKAYLDDRSRLLDDFSAQGNLGKVTGFNFNFDYHEPSKHGLHHSLMFDHLNHEVDLMHFLFGKSDISQATKHHDNETAFQVTGARQDGIEFSFTGARHRKEPIYPEDMKVIFENGTLMMDMHLGLAVLGLDGQTYERHDHRFSTNYATRFEKINRHFLRSVLGLEQPYITSEEMLINTRAAIDLQKQ